MTVNNEHNWQWQKCFAQTFRELLPDQWRLFPASDAFLARNQSQFVQYNFKLRMNCKDCHNTWNSETCTVSFSIPYYLKKRIRARVPLHANPERETQMSHEKENEKKKKRKRRKKKAVVAPDSLISSVEDLTKALSNVKINPETGSMGNPLKLEGPLVKGSIYYRVWGQQCEKCDSEYYYDPFWPKETILLVMESLLRTILNRIYGVDNAPAHPGGPRSKRKQRHKADLCELCSYGFGHD